MKRALIYLTGGVILIWVALVYGPDVLGVADSADGDDSGISRRLDILPWIGLLLVGYVVVAAIIEISIRAHRKKREVAEKAIA